MKSGKKMTWLTRAVLLVALAAAMPLRAADNKKFHPASAVEPVVGRYVVALATAPGGDDGVTADALVRAYGGRLHSAVHSDGDIRGICR